MYRLYSFLCLLLITSSGCLTSLLQDNFDSRSPNIINTNLVGSIPGGPDGDRINLVHPTVISIQEPQLTNQSLRINNRVDFQLADHDAFGRYIVSWKGIQVNSPSANTLIDFLNEDDEVVLTLHFDADDLEVISDYNGTPPQFGFQTDVVHQFTVVFIVQGNNGSTSYADITVREEGNDDDREWGKMPLLGNQIETLKTVRFRAEDSCPYVLDNLSANAN
jgi:hypothetical protein